MRDTGIKVNAPKSECKDKKCPFHGNLKCRGRIFTGTVISTKMQRGANVEWDRKHFIQKYERYEKRRTRVKAHNPECINAKEGDIVKISECRPISKTKNFAIIENLGAKKGFKERMKALEDSKSRPKEKKLEVKDAASESKPN